MRKESCRSEVDIPRAHGLKLTRHAELRMNQEGIRPWQVEAAVAVGHRYYRGGAEHFWVGRRAVRKWRSRGVDISPIENIHVVCRHDGTVITVGKRSRNPRKHRAGRPPRRRKRR